MNTYYLSKILLAASAFVVAAATAQTPTASSPQTQKLPPALHEALKDIPAAGSACRKEDFVDKSGEPVLRLVKKTDPSCAITLEQLSVALGKPDTVVVDTRSKSAFENSHIDGAVNFTASELRTKSYLSNKFIVLLGDGKADQDLYTACSELKGAGFKQTRVLRGGVPTWILENKPVIGTTPSFPDVAGLSPSELFQESKILDNVVIGLPGARKLADVLPMLINVSADNTGTVKDFLQKRKRTNGLSNIILVADERFDKSLVAELARAAKPDPLLIYAGSEAAYRQFLRNQNAMWAKQAKGPTKPRCGGM